VSPFAPRDLVALAAEAEVEIETRAGPEAPVRRTIIWVVVEAGDVYVRSVRGGRGRWYRELTDFPEGALLVGDRRVAIRAAPASDVASIDACSRGLRRKYRGDPSLDSMLRPDVLPTTIRLVPR
jgi:hypothetical protein